MKVVYTYAWFLPAGTLAQVSEIIGALRQRAAELGGEVGSVRVATGGDAGAENQDAQSTVLFSATLPGATEGRYGLVTDGACSGPQPWSWKGAVVISDVRAVSQLHAAAGELGLEVVESFAGIIFETRRDTSGRVTVKQRSAFDGYEF